MSYQKNKRSSFIPRAQVLGVDFHLLSDKEIESIAVTPITSAMIVSNRMENVNGPRSQFLGTDSSRYKCYTCYQSSRNCVTGHCGYIKGFPAFNPEKGIIRITKKVLTILCHNSSCYRFVFSHKKMIEERAAIQKKESKALITHLYNKIKTSPGTCNYCKTPVRIVEENNDFYCILRYTIGGIHKKLYPYEVYDLLTKTSYDDFKEFFPNLPPPDTLCTKNILVSGVPFRINMISPINNKPEVNPITVAFQSLISLSIMYNDEKLPPSNELDDITKINMDGYLFLLRHFVITSIPSLPLDVMQKNKSFSQTVKFLKQKFNNIGLSDISGKGKIIRDQQFSKRVHNIARSVVTCDNTIPFGEVTLPINIMKNLFTEEKIHDYNRIRLMKHYQNGNTFPGASYLIREIDNAKLLIENINSTYTPVNGDIIKRHIGPGDFVIVIRQPTLILSNITSYRISRKINTDSMAIGINPEEYSQLKGGDFDGDESPVVALSGVNGLAEITYILPTHRFLVNIKNTHVMLGAANNCAMGLAMLTLNNDIPKSTIFSLLRDLDMISKGKFVDMMKNKKITGRDIVSLFLPSGTYYQNTPSWYNPLLEDVLKYKDEEKKVIIKDGYMISGVLDNNSIGTNLPNSLFRCMIESIGSIKTLSIIHELKIMSMRYLEKFGFTLSIHDTIISKESRAIIQKQVEILEKDVVKEEHIKFDTNMITAEYGETAFSTMRKRLQEKTLVMDQFLQPIIYGINKWRDNHVIRQFLTVKGGINALLKFGSPLGPVILKGELIKPTIFGRPSRHALSNSRRLREVPYAENNYVRGLSVMDSIVTSPAQRMSLVQRINGTAKSGSDRRERLNAQSIFHLDYYGHLCYGNHYTGIYFASMTYGADGLMVNELAITKIGKILLMKPLSSIKEEYFTPKELHAGTPGRMYGERIWKEFNEIIINVRDVAINSSKIGIIEAKYFSQFYVPFSMELHIDMDEKPVWSRVKHNIKYIDNFAEKLLNIYKNELDCKGSISIVKHKLKLITLYVYFCFSPGMLAKIPENRIEEISEKFYLRYINAIAPPGFSAGTVAAITQSETMVQNSLDAPKKQADTKIAKEEALHAMIYKPRKIHKHPGVHKYLALVKEEYQDTIEECINTITEIRLSMFIQSVDVVRFLTDQNVFDMLDMKNENNSDLANLYLYIRIKRIQLQKYKIKIIEIIDKIEDFHDSMIAVEEKTIGDITVIVVAFISNDISNLYKKLYYEQITYENVKTFVKTMSDSIIIRGYPNILSANLIKNTILQQNKDGSIQEVLKIFMVIHSNNHYGVMNLKIIDHKYMFCENPNIMIELFGLYTTRIGVILASMRVLKTHFNHVATSADILLMKGEAITFGTSGQARRVDRSPLISAVSIDPRGRFINAAIRKSETPISDVLSSQLMGQKPRIGTGMCDIFVLPHNNDDQ